MEYLAGVLMLSAATSFSGMAIARRWLLDQKVIGVNALVFVQMVLASLTALLMVPFWSGWHTPFRDAPFLFWTGIIGSGLINYPIQYANAKSSSLAEASLIAPIQALTPGLVTLAAWLPWIGERPTALALAGIALISVCNYIHAREDATTLQEYLQPFIFLKLPPNFHQLEKEDKEKARKRTWGLRWAYLSAGCGTIGLLFDGLIARNGNAVLGVAYKWAAVALLAVPGFVKFQEGRHPIASLAAIRQRQEGRVVFSVVAAVGITLGLGELLTAIAFRVAPIASVGSLKRLVIPLTILLAWWILHERKAKRRIWPALGVAVGVMLLAFDPGIGAVILRFEEQIGR